MSKVHLLGPLLMLWICICIRVCICISTSISISISELSKLTFGRDTRTLVEMGMKAHEMENLNLHQRAFESRKKD